MKPMSKLDGIKRSLGYLALLYAIQNDIVRSEGIRKLATSLFGGEHRAREIIRRAS